jgi:chaperonin GroES
MATITPIGQRVLVKRLEAEELSAGGIVLPDTAKEKPQEAEVVAVGPGRFSEDGDRIPVDLKVGDLVIFSKYGGTELRYDGQDFLVLSARDILAVIER